MSSVKISFSNGVSVEVKENDLITPVVLNTSNKKIFSQQSEPIELSYHINFGLIPSVMDVACSCDFFYINSCYDIVYGTKTIVSVENI